MTLLEIAIDKDDLDYVQALFQHPKIGDNAAFRLPLNRAIIKGNLKIVDALLNHGAFVEDYDRKEQLSPLLFLALEECRHVDIVARLLKEKKIYSIVYGSTCNGDRFIKNLDVLIPSLIQAGTTEDEYGNTILTMISHWVFSQGLPLDRCNAILELVMQAGLDISAKDHHLGWTPLQRVVRLKAVNDCWIQALLARAQIGVTQRDKEGNTPLHLACMDAKPNTVRILINYYRTYPAYRDCINLPNLAGYTPLHLAVKYNYGVTYNNLGVVNVLLDAGADIDQAGPLSYDKGTSGIINRTFFHESGLTPKIREALKINCNKDVPDIGPPLYLVARKNNQLMMRCLIERGANPYCALKKAILQRELPTLDRLLDILVRLNRNAFNINKQHEKDNDNTLLHTAARTGCPEIVQALLNRHANRNIGNRQFNTPREVASMQWEQAQDPQMKANLKRCIELLR